MPIERPTKTRDWLLHKFTTSCTISSSTSFFYTTQDCRQSLCIYSRVKYILPHICAPMGFATVYSRARGVCGAGNGPRNSAGSAEQPPWWPICPFSIFAGSCILGGLQSKCFSVELINILFMICAQTPVKKTSRRCHERFVREYLDLSRLTGPVVLFSRLLTDVNYTLTLGWHGECLFGCLCLDP